MNLRESRKKLPAAADSDEALHRFANGRFEYVRPTADRQGIRSTAVGGEWRYFRQQAASNIGIGANQEICGDPSILNRWKPSAACVPVRSSPDSSGLVGEGVGVTSSLVLRWLFDLEQSLCDGPGNSSATNCRNTATRSRVVSRCPRSSRPSASENPSPGAIEPRPCCESCGRQSCSNHEANPAAVTHSFTR